ncbi:MAG: hypothetical protein HC838_05175 [Spirulinaceae cyanobacterium RM2_2_10]|nr:hypothetical protein [Spirulinaceae cyanobacterium SM2_1_0]NJO19566.1 hypothetical protein [Spirulinaceae cyanobacterium RM2_2_10]
MTIQYIDGTSQTFEWQAAEQAETVNMASRLQHTLHEEYILLEMGDKLTIIPKQNIKTIEINAVPPKLPPSAVHGVRLVE